MLAKESLDQERPLLRKRLRDNVLMRLYNQGTFAKIKIIA